MVRGLMITLTFSVSTDSDFKTMIRDRLLRR